MSSAKCSNHTHAHEIEAMLLFAYNKGRLDNHPYIKSLSSIGQVIANVSFPVLEKLRLYANNFSNGKMMISAVVVRLLDEGARVFEDNIRIPNDIKMVMIINHLKYLNHSAKK